MKQNSFSTFPSSCCGLTIIWFCALLVFSEYKDPCGVSFSNLVRTVLLISIYYPQQGQYKFWQVIPLYLRHSPFDLAASFNNILVRKKLGFRSFMPLCFSNLSLEL